MTPRDFLEERQRDAHGAAERRRKIDGEHEEPSAESLAEIPELDFTKLRRIPNPHAGREGPLTAAPGCAAAVLDDEVIGLPSA